MYTLKPVQIIQILKIHVIFNLRFTQSAKQIILLRLLIPNLC